MRFTPDNITELTPDEVFVFGSNLAGRHGAGAARLAVLKFGAVYGKGVGLQGQTYALPTKDSKLQTIPLCKLNVFIGAFLTDCRTKDGKTFLLTKIGCGLAGLTVPEVAGLFKNYLPLPPNLVLPKEFHDLIYEETQEP